MHVTYTEKICGIGTFIDSDFKPGAVRAYMGLLYGLCKGPFYVVKFGSWLSQSDSYM